MRIEAFVTMSRAFYRLSSMLKRVIDICKRTVKCVEVFDT